jgi:hypothetical protein
MLSPSHCIQIGQARLTGSIRPESTMVTLSGQGRLSLFSITKYATIIAHAAGRCGSAGSWLMDHRAAFLPGHLTRQEQADAAADGSFHPLAGALVAKEAGRLAHQVVHR